MLFLQFDKLTVLALLTGFCLDIIFGDPQNNFHIIRFIGILISKTEKILRKIFSKSKRSQFVSGIILVIIVTAVPTGLTILILKLSYGISIYLKFIVESFLCYQILATKSLKDESMKVYYALKNDGIIKAREKLSMIVGRDTENLSEEGVIKGAVETVAENTSDGIIAPMLFIAIGGAPLGIFYKAVNTMDSMVGYKNERYLYFGRCAAKLDDIMNYIPARLSAYFMIIASFFAKLNTKNAYRIYKRDRYNHASPNSAHTEAVCAGALGVELAGDAYYFGKLYKKKTIGDPLRPIEIEDIKKANNLLYISSFISLVICLIIRSLISWY